MSHLNRGSAEWAAWSVAFLKKHGIGVSKFMDAMRLTDRREPTPKAIGEGYVNNIHCWNVEMLESLADATVGTTVEQYKAWQKEIRVSQEKERIAHEEAQWLQNEEQNIIRRQEQMALLSLPVSERSEMIDRISGSVINDVLRNEARVCQNPKNIHPTVSRALRRHVWHPEEILMPEIKIKVWSSLREYEWVRRCAAGDADWLSTYSPTEYLTYSNIIRRPGWTRSLVPMLLGVPDVYGPSRWWVEQKAKLYRLDRVLAAETVDEFLSSLQRRRKRIETRAMGHFRSA